LLKLLSLTLIGLVLAHPKILPKETFNLLCKLVFVLFLPCLIFTHLGPSISFINFINWWFIPVNVVISTAIGCILGCLVAIICRPPTEFYRFTIIMIALGNTGNIPFAIVASICHSTDSPFGPDCYGSGVAYVSFAQWVSVILVYTLVYHMMEPPLDCYEIVEEENEIEEPPVDDPSRPLLVEAEWPVLEDKETEHCKTPLIARLFNSISSVSQTNVIDPESVEEEGEGSPKPVRCLAEPRMVKKIRIAAKQTPIQHIIQPPTIASLLAIIIVMLVLGGKLAEGPNESRLGTRTTVGIIVARLLVLPLIGIGVIYLADRWNFLVADDKLYRFVLLLQYTTPSAILLGAIARLRGYAVREASAVIFWQHVVALFSLSLYMIVYFELLLSY
ncbi:LOW QUALITY PROTEIN: Mem_trans domain-containing protein, partial [Cephalotus follicularis]